MMMKIKMAVVTFKGIKYRGEKPPSRKGMKASEREREIRSLIDEGKLKRVEPRGESKRVPVKKHCIKWGVGPKPMGAPSRGQVADLRSVKGQVVDLRKAPLVEVVKPSKLEEKKAVAPKKRRGRPPKKQAMADRMAKVRAAKKKK
jgi:hypothetical protein